jgi:putative acetyltransferase
MTRLLIRPETPADIPAVDRVLRRAFPGPAEAALVERLRDSGQATVSLVAETGDTAAGSQVVGHVLFSPVSLVAQCAADGGFGLAPVAVDPDHQGHGIGSWLVTEGLGACRRRGARFVVVLGDPGWYRRFGFEPARRYGLDSEYDAGDAFQVLPLRPGTLPTTGGLVRYGAAFAGL